MKKYIKKALWIIPFVFSLNLSATTYYFVNTGTTSSPGTGSNISDWNTKRDGTGSAATSFNAPSAPHVWDLNGRVVDIAGIKISVVHSATSVRQIKFIAPNGFTSGLVNTGTFEVDCKYAPVISALGAISVDFSSAGKFKYSYSGSGGVQEIAGFSYYNLEFSGNDKTISSGGSLSATMTSLNSMNIIYSSLFELGRNSQFSLYTGTKSTLNYDDQVDITFTDNRISANQLFPETWECNIIDQILNPGTYDNMIVLETQHLGGNITILNSLDFSAPNTVPSFFDINDYTLTLSGTISNGDVFIQGSDKSNLNCKASNTLYFDQENFELKRTIKNLSVSNNATINLGNWLNITGGTSTSGFGVVDVASSSTLNTQGYLTLKSNEYGTAMIGTIAGTLQKSSSNNTGTLLVENFIPSTSRGRQYRFLSSPVSGGVFLQWRDSLITVLGNPRPGRGTHITGKQSGSAANDFDESTTNHPSAFTWDETKAGDITGISTTLGAAEDPGWSRLSDAYSNTIENGTGYRVLIRGDRTVRLTSGGTGSAYDPNPTTIQTRGGYVAGPVTVPITNSGSKSNNGINLIGNPYACAVDWKAVYNASSNVDAAYVLYDPVGKTWQAYNAASSTPPIYQYISPGQSFLVYTNNPTTSGGGGGGSVVFPLMCKTTSDAGSRTFTEIKTNHLITHLRRDTTAADMNIIYFLGGATNYYDKYDAGHIQNEYVNLSSVDSTNTLYNINCLDSLVGQRIVPLSVYGTPKGIYTMAFDDVNTFRNHDVFLIDNFLKKTTKVDDFTQYNVEITEDKFSYAEGRFYISFEPTTTSSIVSLTKTENFNINPNPVKDLINISMKKSILGDLQFEIFNINGQIISKGSLNEGETRINSTDLSKGIYFITLKTNSETQTIKFIK